MKNYVVVHIMPYEIDWFEWQAKQLKVGSVCFKDSDDEVIIDATLNLNLVDWEKSQIPKQFFIDKFESIMTTCFDWCETISDINQDRTCLGVDDKRRNSIRNTNDADNFIYLDCDVVFKPETLKVLIDASKVVNTEYYIISPQIPKLWDSSWDVLVNDYNLNDPWDNKTFVDPYSLLVQNYGQYQLKQIPVFKFGGGWFNLLSSSLLKVTDIPDSFGSYGSDDTYVMLCSTAMRNAQKDVSQFVVDNLVVAENHRYRVDNYAKYLLLLNNRIGDKEKAEVNLHSEVANFINKMQNIQNE